jgi:hypothetical protein
MSIDTYDGQVETCLALLLVVLVHRVIQENIKAREISTIIYFFIYKFKNFMKHPTYSVA